MVFARVGAFVSLSTVCCGYEQKAQQWWHQAAAMRTVSPLCNSMTFSDLLASVDDVHASGTTVFAINSAYDSGFGYDGAGLWCGLAISDLMNVSKAIGSQEAWDQLEQTIHSKDMSLVTWMNPSYFWTGSSYFKIAEQDIKKYGVNSPNIPATSPALWFRWREDNPDGETKPSDTLDWTGNPPPTNGGTGWVWIWSPEANAAYLSIWGHQPCTDWLSPQWQEQFRTVATHWIEEMNVDGFVFDFPDGYIGSGSSNSHLSAWQKGGDLWSYDPDIIKQYITDVIHDVGDNRVAAFAELYPDDWSVERSRDFGFDAVISDDGGYGKYKLAASAVLDGVAGALETAFTGDGSADALRSQCIHSNGGRCAIPWTRFVVGTPWFGGADLTENNFDCSKAASYVKATGMTSLAQCFDACAADEQCEAITVGWDTRSPVVEVECHLLGGVDLSSCPTTDQACEACPYGHSTFELDAPAKLAQAAAITVAGGSLLAIERGADGAWWSANDWPGRWEASLALLLRTFEQNAAFHSLSLRVQLIVPGHHWIGQYAMLRYDFRNSGSAAMAVFNFEEETASFSMDLSQLARFFGQTPTNLLTGQPAAAPLARDYYMELPAHGMALLGLDGLGVWTQQDTTSCPTGQSTYSTSLDSCLLDCLGDETCNTVSVTWGANLNTGQVSCNFGGFELSDCTPADSDHTVFVRSPSVAEAVTV